MARAQTNLAWDTLLQIDRGRSAGALHARLTQALRDAIRTGRIPSGSALPPSRQMASDLGCSRWVVTEAYEQLVSEGYLEARVGSGTRVRLSDQEMPVATAGVAVPRPAPRFDLSPGSPDIRSFPRAAWARAFRETIASMQHADFDYQTRGGHPRLRQVLAEYLRRVRGAEVHWQEVTITSGILDGITLVARALAAAGYKSIALEEPSWDRLFLGVRTAGLAIVPIPVEPEGMRVGLLAARKVRAAVVAPAHQFPTGAVLSPEGRSALLEWVRAVNGLILEDDYDAEFRYDRRPVGTLQGTDPAHVALFGSLSKTLAPAIGVGWIVTPRVWTEAVQAAEARMTGASTLEQLSLAQLIETGAYDRHLRAVRRRYRARHDRLVAAIARRLPECALSGAAAGLHLLLTLPSGLEGAAVARAASVRGVRLTDLRTCMLNGRKGPTEGLVIGYGKLDDAVVESAVDALAGAIHSLRK